MPLVLMYIRRYAAHKLVFALQKLSDYAHRRGHSERLARRSRGVEPNPLDPTATPHTRTAAGVLGVSPPTASAPDGSQPMPAQSTARDPRVEGVGVLNTHVYTTSHQQETVPLTPVELQDEQLARLRSQLAEWERLVVPLEVPPTAVPRQSQSQRQNQHQQHRGEPQQRPATGVSDTARRDVNAHATRPAPAHPATGDERAGSTDGDDRGAAAASAGIGGAGSVEDGPRDVDDHMTHPAAAAAAATVTSGYAGEADSTEGERVWSSDDPRGGEQGAKVAPGYTGFARRPATARGPQRRTFLGFHSDTSGHSVDGSETSYPSMSLEELEELEMQVESEVCGLMIEGAMCTAHSSCVDSSTRTSSKWGSCLRLPHPATLVCEAE